MSLQIYPDNGSASITVDNDALNINVSNEFKAKSQGQSLKMFT